MFKVGFQFKSQPDFMLLSTLFVKENEVERKQI